MIANINSQSNAARSFSARPLPSGPLASASLTTAMPRLKPDVSHLRSLTTANVLPEIAVEQAALVHSLNDWMCDALVAGGLGTVVDLAQTVLRKHKNIDPEARQPLANVTSVVGALALASFMVKPTRQTIQAFQTRNQAQDTVMLQKETALKDKIASVQFPDKILIK